MKVLAILLCLATAASARMAYVFSDGYLDILGAEPAHNFDCTGRPYGYYADVATGCKVFHVCLPIPDETGQVRETAHFSFFCGNQTIFDQESKTCNHEYNAFPCSEAENLYEMSNADFGKIPEEGDRGRGDPIVFPDDPVRVDVRKEEVEVEAPVPQGRSIDVTPSETTSEDQDIDKKPKEKAEEIPKEKPQDTPQDTPQETPETPETPEETPQETPETPETPEETPEETPQETPEEPKEPAPESPPVDTAPVSPLTIEEEERQETTVSAVAEDVPEVTTPNDLSEGTEDNLA